MDIKEYTEEVIEKLNNLSDKEFDELLEDGSKDIKSNKFHVV